MKITVVLILVLIVLPFIIYTLSKIQMMGWLRGMEDHYGMGKMKIHIDSDKEEKADGSEEEKSEKRC